MDFLSIEALVIAGAPALSAIIGCIAAVVKLIKNSKMSNKQLVNQMSNIGKQITDREQYEHLKSELALAHQENRELKKQLNKVLSHMDHIYRENEEEI